jgi:hypothetical protein
VKRFLFSSLHPQWCQNLANYTIAIDTQGIRTCLGLFRTLCALIKLTLDASDHIFLSFADLSLGVQEIIVCLQSQFHPEGQLLEGLHMRDIGLDPTNLLDGCFPSKITWKKK